MLIAFTLLAVVFYVCFVRPTVLAKRFVAAIERGDYQAADAMCLGEDPHFVSEAHDEMRDPGPVTAKVEPRSWRNVWKMNRIIEVGIIQSTEVKTNAGQLVRTGLHFDAVAGVFGVRPSEKILIDHEYTN